MKLKFINPDSGMSRAELAAREALLSRAAGPDTAISMDCPQRTQVCIDSDLDVAVAAPEIVQMALQAAEQLAGEGISVRVIDLFTWKPLDEELVIKAARETGAIVTAENHNVTCGLGSVVANCLAKNAPTIQEFVGVQDRFGQVGPQDFLMDEYGLRSVNIVALMGCHVNCHFIQKMAKPIWLPMWFLKHASCVKRAAP